MLWLATCSVMSTPDTSRDTVGGSNSGLITTGGNVIERGGCYRRHRTCLCTIFYIIFVALKFFLLQEAQDVWSLGVMAFELLTGQAAVLMLHGKERVRTG